MIKCTCIFYDFTAMTPTIDKRICSIEIASALIPLK